jgi:hypothetical protein
LFAEESQAPTKNYNNSSIQQFFFIFFFNFFNSSILKLLDTEKISEREKSHFFNPRIALQFFNSSILKLLKRQRRSETLRVTCFPGGGSTLLMMMSITAGRTEQIQQNTQPNPTFV